MTTDVHTSELLLAYDGDCPMCLATIGTLLRFGLVRAEQTRANYDLEGDDLEAARAAGIRNQLVVIDLATRQTRAGADALIWIIGETTGNRALVWLLRLPGVRHLLRYGYETVSYNRRVISPPRHQIVCDCEPEVTVGRRMTLVVPLLLAGVLLWSGFGAAAFAGWGLGPSLAGAGWALLAAGAGPALLAILGFVRLGGLPGLDYAAHLTVTLFVGGLVMLPATILALLVPTGALLAIAGVSLVVALALMFRMQRRRVKAVGLGPAWLYGWAIVTLASGGCAIAAGFAGFFS